MSDTILVLLHHRDPESVTNAEWGAMRRIYGGAHIELRRTDPRDHHEHLRNCRELKPAFVLEPQFPVTLKAMEAGVPHVFVSGALGTLHQIEAESLKTQSREFVPEPQN